MDGQIVTSGEQRQAMKLSDQLTQIIKQNPSLTNDLTPSRDFLLSLAWKGSR